VLGQSPEREPNEARLIERGHLLEGRDRIGFGGGEFHPEHVGESTLHGG